MNPPFIQGKDIFLRAAAESDAALFARAYNSPGARDALYIALPTSAEQQRESIRRLVNDHTTILFTICLNNGEAIGLCSLVRIDWPGRMATFYIAIADEEQRSRGYGGQALALITDYAFNTVNLNRLQLHVSVENKRAVKAYKRQGFIIEGTLRQAMYYKGRYIDFHLMALLKEDYQRMEKGDAPR